MKAIELTDQQRQAIQAEPGKPVDVVDPTTKQAYVLVARAVRGIRTDSDAFGRRTADDGPRPSPRDDAPHVPVSASVLARPLSASPTEIKKTPVGGLSW